MMMGMIRKKSKQDLLNQISNNTKTFKYKFTLNLGKYINDKFIAIKNTCKKIKGVVQLQLNKFDFKTAGSISAIWLVNAFIEGVIVNFAVWGLLGWKFNFITIMAWGFAIKQLLDLYWRLRINGSNTKLPEKH